MKLICFTSAQGGVGRSQLITNIAYLLSTLGRRVGVIDLNGRKIPELLKTVAVNQLILLNAPEDSNPLTLIGRWKEKGVEYILVNTHILECEELTADYILIVTTPLRLSLIENMRVAEVLRKSFGNAKIGVILNKVGECEEYEYNKFIVEKLLGVPVLHQIPYDKSFIRSEQLGEPIQKLFDKKELLIPLLKLVNRIFEIPIPVRKYEKTFTPSFLTRFWRR
ncbi:MAG: P-loop NTPase [Candidatus Odinarchaeum yellowstonii]|uniref:P-loop NTPase n=1 Tax=Odinarchaeota yellowstonii (strain LCB_4) TaxID=1841599 RepID=A0AAF0D3D8_ODILC|nr:MAG: P-loop NTPase [Candidatus Odinarchaeum yellowstonii]